jgi:hypothetical protein
MHRLAVLLGDFVVWQMGMKIEGRDVFEETQLRLSVLRQFLLIPTRTLLDFFAPAAL